LKQQFFFSQSDFEIPGNPQSVLDPGDTSHFKAVVKTGTEMSKNSYIDLFPLIAHCYV
jgi:hypothetical protein